MKVVLTGGNGFIGRNLRDKLGSGYEIIPISHRDTDLTDYVALRERFRQIAPDAVIHAAAKPGHRFCTDRTNLTLTNLQLFTSVFRAAKDVSAKFITFGSGSEFDMSEPIVRIREGSGGRIPKDETGFPRYVINALMQGQPESYNLRCFGVFGPYEEETRFISQCILTALAGKDITVLSDKRFSFVYIDDLVRITAHFLQNHFQYNDYNIVPHETFRLSEIARMVRDKIDPTLQVTVAGEGMEYTGDNTRLCAEYPNAFTPMQQALDAYIAYYKSKICVE